MPIHQRRIGQALDYGHPGLYNLTPPSRMLQDVAVRKNAPPPPSDERETVIDAYP